MAQWSKLIFSFQIKSSNMGSIVWRNWQVIYCLGFTRASNEKQISSFHLVTKYTKIVAASIVNKIYDKKHVSEFNSLLFEIILM